ncbi:hypothetical protein AWN90_26730 [Nocardia terpenica]|uniref:Uncharacterized protein n=1 Tax=Nocardia terpenica TaxID=455432 RepID=A0A161XG23_9NOCA|nr:hypothetical protein AWN90_26730 [Nocardia terpenica]
MLSAPGRLSAANTRLATPSITNHAMFASASTISALSVPPSSSPIAANVAVPRAITIAPNTRPPADGRQPSATPMSPSTIDCSTTTISTAAHLPPTMPQRGNAVAPSRFSAP